MTHGIVCAAQPEAAEAGARALMRGGNAIDAAIACALVQGVIDPLMSGIGGVGTAVVHVPAKNLTENVNFLGVAPSAANDDMWADKIKGETADAFGFVLEGRVNALGHQAAMVPGNPMGYYTLLEAHGTMDWADICAAAIQRAEEGWVVRPHVYSYANQDEAAQGRVHNSEILGFTKEGRDLYLGADGLIHRPGTVIRNPDLANTLRLIAAGGVDAYYKGEIAERISDDMASNGGLINREDLANYASVHQPALQSSYRGLGLATNQPGGSGIQVLETLNILENFDLAPMGHNTPNYLRTMAEALAFAYNDKRLEVGDPNFIDVPLDRLTDKTYAADLAARVTRGEAASIDRMAAAAESKDTTHVSTLDEHGNALTMTHTLGAPSGVIVPGTGFILNGCMGIFDPRPGRAMSIAPGKSYTSSMSPTILFEDEAPHIVIGAPGAAYIPQAIIQAIVNSVDFGMRMSDAVAAPRIAVTKNRTIDVSNRIPGYVTEALEAEGYRIDRSHLSYAFAGVHGIKQTDQGWQGGADPGRDGVALVV